MNYQITSMVDFAIAAEYMLKSPKRYVIIAK